MQLSTSTSLGLRALIKTGVARSGLDADVRLVSGLTPSVKALYVASAAHNAPNGVVLYVVPGDGDIDQSVADIRYFLAALEGISGLDLDRSVLPFPSHEVDPYRGMAPHVGVTSARARALHSIVTGRARVVVSSAPGLLPRISAPDRLLQASIELKPGQEIEPEVLGRLLVDAGFRREDPADEHGEFAIRGGILDLFPAGATHPFRIEFIGDTIETLRTYDPATQRSILPVDWAAVVPLRDLLPADPDHATPERTEGELDRSATLFDYLALPSKTRVIVSEADEVGKALETFDAQMARSFADASESGRAVSQTLPPWALFTTLEVVAPRLESATALAQLALGDGESSSQDGSVSSGRATAHVRCQPVIEMNGRFGDWVAELRRLKDDRQTVLFVAATPGRAERTIEVLKEYDLLAVPVDQSDDARYAAVLVSVGSLSRGFRLPDAGLAVYAEPDVFEEERRAPERRRAATRAFLSDLRDLKPGDLVVHVDHGIGAFVGLKQIGFGDSVQEFLELRYAGDDKLFVPVERLDLVQKYTGATRPPLDRLGGASWERAKSRVKKAMRDMAEDLLKLYAARKAVAGHAFSPDSHWQQEFEDAFEYELTPDQRTAITDIKGDMESSTPMDRLLCGDVGYGKTEVAMRAAFKAVMDGKQVAFLAPTTVLAFQHQKTLAERFAGFPVRIDMVSRFRTKAEQKMVLGDLADGKVDIFVGTHRLLSKDVQ
ncbi:MAG: CarD family transcriptional regulator, partial [Vicinamibacterales bacterium]